MPFGVSSGIPNVIIHAKFHVDWLRGFWTAGPPKVPFPILIGTTLTTVLHYCAVYEQPTVIFRLCLTGLVFFYKPHSGVALVSLNRQCQNTMK